MISVRPDRLDGQVPRDAVEELPDAQTLEWVTPVMYLRGRDSRLFIMPTPSPGHTAATPRTAVTPEGGDRAPLPGQAQPVGWTWERYRTELKIPPERVEVGQRLIEAIVAALGDRHLPWHVFMRKGYIAIQRSGGYNVVVVDLWGNRVPRLAGKVPAEPGKPWSGQPLPSSPRGLDPGRTRMGLDRSPWDAPA